MKAFLDLNTYCIGCGGHTQVYTSEWETSKKRGCKRIMTLAEWCLPGDFVRCVNCQCQGWIEYDACGAYVYWPADLCAACYRQIDSKLSELAISLNEKFKSIYP